MKDCNPLTSPMDSKIHPTRRYGPVTADEAAYMAKFPYGSIVGALNYLASTSRPDIAYAVSVLARYLNDPRYPHAVAAKRVLRYLQGTKHLKLVYGQQKEGEPFITYSDADHGGCLDTGRSTSGYMVRVGGAAVSWRSKLQTMVTLSTTEAEYIAAVEAGKEIIWMSNIHGELGQSITSPPTLFIDNQSAIQVAKNPEHHGRMKHLDLKYFWLRDRVGTGELRPVHVPTNENAADLLTKPLPRERVEYLRALFGLQ
jgi:hypothetical protein